MTSTITPQQLELSLHELDVPFLSFSGTDDEEIITDSSMLIQALATQSDARLRLALIPLFLRHPHLNEFVLPASQILPYYQAQSLKFYYSATVVLQRLHWQVLTTIIDTTIPLPNLFTTELALTGETREDQLQIIGRHHRDLTGRDLNWVGTYRHGAERFIKQMLQRNPDFITSHASI